MDSEVFSFKAWMDFRSSLSQTRVTASKENLGSASLPAIVQSYLPIDSELSRHTPTRTEQSNVKRVNLVPTTTIY